MTETRQANGWTGSHRDRLSRDRSRRWWSVTALACAVASTTFLVPTLVSPVPPQQAATPGPIPILTPTLTFGPTATPTPEAFAIVRLAATDPGNERIGVEVTDCVTCASGSRVQYVGPGHALIVHVRGIRVPGPRTLTITYETQGARPLDVIVNGGTTISLTLSGKDSWITPAEVSLPIDLPVGDTVIKLFHANRPAPDLDQITIS